MFLFFIWTYWYIWATLLIGFTLTGICGYWLWNRRTRSSSSNSIISDRRPSNSCCPPPHYSRCSSFVQTLPPPYNEVTAKPDLYPLVIGFDEGIGKGSSGFVMRYFRTLSHTSTLDSLSSSFICNVVNETNTMIPPPYSIESGHNSIDGLSPIGGNDRGEIGDAGSILSFTNNRTTSDVSSLAAHSPCSPPQATSPTIELRELLDKIQQLPQEPLINPNYYQNRPETLNFLGINSRIQRSSSPGEYSNTTRIRRACGKIYMPLGQTITRNKIKGWLSRSAPATPSGTIPMTFMPGQNFIRTSDLNNYHHQQAIPLLSEQEENYNTREESHES